MTQCSINVNIQTDPLFFRINISQTKTVRLNKVQLLADMVEQELTLCIFLEIKQLF